MKAQFVYRCSDPACPGHGQSLIDWELGALYRSRAEKGDDEVTLHAKIRQEFFEQYCSDCYDTRFITGSMLKRDHTECHRDVIVKALQELRPALAVSHL